MPLTSLRSLAAAGALVVALSVGVAACGPAAEDAPPTTVAPDQDIEMTGTGGSAPTFDFSMPLALDGPKAELAWEGTGDPVVDGQPVLLRIYSVSGVDGTVIRNDFESVPVPYLLSPEGIGSQLFKVISGQRVGSRLMFAALSDDGTGATSVVSSIDILSTRAIGDPIDPDPMLPTVERDERGKPTVTIPADVEPPMTSVVRQLVRGAGDQVETGEQAVIQFVTVKWSTGEVVESTWDEGRLPATISVGLDQLVEGVEAGLVDLPVGSQVMLVVPPGMAFGLTGNELSTEILVYVIDILAVTPSP